MSKFVTIGTWTALAATTVFAAGCVPLTTVRIPAPPMTKALRDLVDRTVAAAGRNDMAAYLKYHAPRVSLVLPGMPITEMNGPLQNSFAPGYAIRMVTTKAEVSNAGDLGYAFGTYQRTAPDKSGALVNSVGKWMSVFRRQPDGSWRAIADTYNVDPVPTA